MGNLWGSSWKGQLERGEPLPADLELTEEVLRKMGVAKRKAKIVLQNLRQQERETWGNLLVLFAKGEEEVKREVGDEVSGETIWAFFKEYSAKSGVALVPPSRDVTAAVLQSLLQDLNELPSLEDLERLLLQPVSTQIPVPPRIVEALLREATSSQDSGLIKGLIRASVTECTKLEFVFHSLLNLDVAETVIGHTEDQVHQLYNLFFQKLLRRLLKFKHVEFDIDRNATEGSDQMTTTKSGTKRSSGSRKTGSDSAKKRAKALHGNGVPSPEIKNQGSVSSLRPDFKLSIKTLLFLRGEEKRHGVEFKDAEVDLISKTLWCPAVMGRLPYILAYAACGEKMRLYAIHPLPSTNDVKLRRLGRELDLTRTGDALEIVGWMIQVARVLTRANEDIVCDNVPPINRVWERASGQYSKITFRETSRELFVEKCLLESDGHRVRWDGLGGLNELYNLIEAGLITGTIRLKDIIRSTSRKRNEEVSITLLLEPVGYRVVPLLQELRDFLTDVLDALYSMHRNGWVHRDVKLKNIVKRPDGHWMLIDLEYAAKLDGRGSADWPWFDREQYPMPERKGNARWRPEHDVKQVAIMLEQLDCFEQHRHRSDIIKILMSATAANVMDLLRPFLS